MKKITITTTSFCQYNQSPLKNLTERGFEPILNPYGRQLKKVELMELAKDAVGIIAGTEQIDAAVIKSLRGLRVISRCGVGIDNVDLVAAHENGVKVYNTPDAPTLAVAELTVGLMLDMIRKISQMDRMIRSGQWKKQMGNLLFTKKIGIIGYGRIGKKVAALLRPFDCNICYADTMVEDYSLGVNRLALNDLLEWAEIISIHVSSANEIIGANEMKRMKRGAWIVNVSRGGVINEMCLYENLKNGYLAGAAIDVYEKEPYEGILRELDNIILTPHIGSYAMESRIEMEAQAVANLLEGLSS